MDAYVYEIINKQRIAIWISSEFFGFLLMQIYIAKVFSVGILILM